jgi:hypothetical protein
MSQFAQPRQKGIDGGILKARIVNVAAVAPCRQGRPVERKHETTLFDIERYKRSWAHRYTQAINSGLQRQIKVVQLLGIACGKPRVAARREPFGPKAGIGRRVQQGVMRQVRDMVYRMRFQHLG